VNDQSEKTFLHLWIQRPLNWLQSYLFPVGITSQKQMLAANRDSDHSNEYRGHTRKILVAVTSILFLALYIYATAVYYPNTAKRIAQHPLVTNLSKLDFEAKYRLGTSTLCDSMTVLCWVKSDFDDSTWKSAKFPATNIKKLPEYPEGFKTGSIFYRLHIEIPEKLLNQPQEIAFSPMYVNHSSFSMFINGRLVHSANSVNQSPPLVSISIPRSDITDGKVLITIQGKNLTELDAGLFHRAAWYMGPEPILRGLFVHNERAAYTFYLLFLLAKGGIFLIFSLTFIFTNGQRGFFSFLVFAFCVTAESLFIGDFLTSTFNISERIVIIFYLKTIATIGLLGFFTKYYGIKNSTRNHYSYRVACPVRQIHAFRCV